MYRQQLVTKAAAEAPTAALVHETGPAKPAAAHTTTATGKQAVSCHMTLELWLAVGSLHRHAPLSMLQEHRKPLHYVMQWLSCLLQTPQPCLMPLLMQHCRIMPELSCAGQ